MTSRLLSLGTLALALLVTACGGAATLDEKIDALQASYDGGSYEQVVADAPALATEAGDDAAKAWKVEKLHLLALGRLGRGADAAGTLERLDGAFPGKVKANLYGQVGGFVVDAGNALEAIDVLDAGAKKYPEMADAVFKPYIEQCKEMATSAGDSEALAKLKSLGYL